MGRKDELETENTLTASSSGGIEIQVHKSFDAKSIKTHRDDMGGERLERETWSGRTRVESGEGKEDRQRLNV